MSKRARVTAIVAVVIAGAIVFELPGAWLFARGAPWWAALAAALVGFPLLPVGWHLLGERKRKRGLAAAAASAKPGIRPKTSTLTGGDRFTMRLVAVALVALGPLLFFRHGQVWHAVKKHPLWFIPQGPPAPPSFHGDPRLAAQVPADAELVIWARRLDALSAEQPAKGEADDQPKEVLIAMHGAQVLLVVRGPDKALAEIDLAEINDQLGKSPIKIDGPLVSRRRSSDTLVVVSEGWAQEVDDRNAGRGDAPAAIMTRLAAAPADAAVIMAAAPARPVAGLNLTAMQSWLRLDQRRIRIDADFFVPDQAAATALQDRMETERRELSAAVPDDCRPKIDGLLRGVQVVGGETVVSVNAWWKPEQVGEAMMCGLGLLMKNADWK